MDAAFFKTNRERLGTKVGGLVVLAANNRMQSTNDAFYPFEQEANFWYLSGINEPDWLLVSDGNRGKSWLIAPEVEDMHATFDGSLDPDEAKRQSGVDEVLSIQDGLKLLHDLSRKHSIVYTLGDHPGKSYFNFVENPAGHELHKQLERIFSSVQDCRKDISKLRAIKQPEEIKAIQRAIRLTNQAFGEVKEKFNNFKAEYEIEAKFDYVFRSNDAGHAYTPIVAAGGNACTLHYVDNRARLKKRSLVIMDIGARVDGYAADITRTYSFGEPTARQRLVHEVVAEAERACVNLLEPGLLVQDYLRSVDEIMKDALEELGLLKDRTNEDTYRKYFPHAISHGLGIDVHDSLGGARYFEPGMVVTVEPGIYVANEAIGVRIEDDILITPNGHKNLSAALSTDL